MKFFKKDKTSSSSSSKDVYYPHANKPSVAQRILEVLCLLLLLCALPLWLGGVMAIFLTIYAVALALLGLFAWPRRHAWLWVIAAIILMIALLVNLILVATNNARTVPFNVNHNNNCGSFTQIVNGVVTTGTVICNTSKFNGSRILVYIVESIMMVLLFITIPFAIKVALENRESRDSHYIQERTQTTVRTGATAPASSVAV